MSLADIIQQKNIKEVLHFTTNHGLVGSFLTKNVISRKRLPKDEYLEHILQVNSAFRPENNECFDKSEDWLDYVNLSISEINAHYFKFSTNWHQGKDTWWAILSFNPDIMTHDGVYFATTNNAYEFCQRQKMVEGFNNLFKAIIKRKGTWYVSRYSRPTHLPTCQQAEVLYPGQISIDHLKKIYVKEGDQHDLVKSWLKQFGITDVDVIIDPEKFIGMPN